jgi:hypothetical protein
MRGASLVFRSVALVAGLAYPLAAAAQPPAASAATGLILGRVVDAATSHPIGGAIVTLESVSMLMPGAPTPETRPRAMTSASGHFVFRRLEKGSYGLTVTKPGYADGAYGRRRPLGSQRSVELAEGQRVGEVMIPIWKFGAVSGTVIDEAGEPLIGVQIRAFQRRITGGRGRLVSDGQAVTDDRGIYRIASLVPADYVVAFVAREVTMPAATADLMRVPSNNDPKYQELLRERFAIGFSMAAPGTVSTMQVGDLLRSLSSAAPVPPGPAANGPIFVYPTQFYPGTNGVAKAANITLATGQERANVDFTLRPVRTARVSGIVLGSDGPVANVGLRLVPTTDEFVTELETSTTMSGASGEYMFLGVPPGQYTVNVLRVPSASPGPGAITQIQVGSSIVMSSMGAGGSGPQPIPTAPTLWSNVAVAVAESDVTNVAVVLQPGARVSGRLDFEGALERPTPDQLTRVPILLEHIDRASTDAGFNRIPPGHADNSGNFTTYGVPPGKYLVRLGGALRGWTLRSIISEGRDLSDVPLQLGTADTANVVITFTDRPTQLTGFVRGASGAPDPDSLLVVFPADSGGWTDYGINPRRMRSTRPSKTGAYTIAGLPPGDYYVAAVREESIAQWQDPQVLQALTRSAEQVRLSEGDPRTVDVRSVVVVR